MVVGLNKSCGPASPAPTEASSMFPIVQAPKSSFPSVRHLELAYVDVISSYFAVEVQRTYKVHVFHFISTLFNNVSLIKKKKFCVGLGVQIILLVH